MPASTHLPILIAGPTASGKSALALTIAEQVGGVIINVDALQVYTELEILTARPSQADLARAPHLLYGHVSATNAYSAGRFVIEAQGALAQAHAAGQRPILVGGTGLYFKALLEGLSPIPEIPAAVRGHWRSEAQRLGARALHEVLALRDPAMAQRLRPTDPQRLTRALEVIDATGRSLAYWQSLPGEPVLTGPSIKLAMAVDADELLKRGEARFDAMLAAGALEEVQRLLKLDLSEDLPVWGAVGVAPLVQYLQQELSLEAAVDRAKVDTRQYVKRQKTWAKRNMVAWNVVHMDEIERNRCSIMQFIDNFLAVP